MTFKETTLVNDYAKLQFLIKSVKESFGHDLTCKLLYRASRDGWLHSDFHRLCDNKGPTVVIVKVSNGRLCGGYCSIGWKSSGGWKHDNNSFVFSLDSLKKYNESQPGHGGHLHWGSSTGPYFGCGSTLGFESYPMNQANTSYCDINQQSLIVTGDS
jgi:hypothetical protein